MKRIFFFLQLLNGSANQIRGTAQRPYEILKSISGFQEPHLHRGRADRHKYDTYRTRLAVIVTDRQRYTLAHLVNLCNDKLAGLTVFCDTGGFHDHGINVIRQFLGL